MSVMPCELPTVGVIARRLGVPLHKVEYVIRARRIEAAGRAGNARVFTDADVDRIFSELRRMESPSPDGVLTADVPPKGGV